MLALGLPFGGAASASGPGAIILIPILVQDVGSLEHGPNGEIIAVPGRLRMQLSPLVMPGWSVTAGARPGRRVDARVPLVALVVAALFASRRRSPVLARRAALAGGVALVACGVLSALPSTGAVVSVFGLGVLATVGRLNRQTRRVP